MRTKLLTTLLLTALLLSAACFKSSKASGDDSFDPLGFSDESQEAIALITDANADLKKVKTIYRENIDKVEEIKAAMGNKDVDKIKKIADDLVTQINEGMALGENAYSKIDKASDLKINDTFREYLSLKALCLRKQLDAFDFRRQAAIQLREGVGDKDPKQIIAFKEKEDNFQKYMEEARKLSQDANLLYKESMKQTK